MKAKIRNIVKNPRYRLLQVGEQHYIIDLGNHFWKIIFPFFFWIFPNRVYQVSDQEIIKQLRAPLTEKGGVSGTAIYAGMAVILSNVFGSAVHYLEISIPLWLNLILLIIALLSVVIIFLSYNRSHKEKLYHIVKLGSLSTYKIWLRPNSGKHIFKMILIYVWLLGFAVMGALLFLIEKNFIGLIVFSLLIPILLVGSRVAAEEGTTTVKIISNQKDAG